MSTGWEVSGVVAVVVVAVNKLSGDPTTVEAPVEGAAMFYGAFVRSFFVYKNFFIHLIINSN